MRRAWKLRYFAFLNGHEKFEDRGLPSYASDCMRGLDLRVEIQERIALLSLFASREDAITIYLGLQSRAA